jgi:hypothetical protein
MTAGPTFLEGVHSEVALSEFSEPSIYQPLFSPEHARCPCSSVFLADVLEMQKSVFAAHFKIM